jgi:hypothetical protein
MDTDSETYEISVMGRLDPHWSDWFNGLCVTEQDQAVTVLTGQIADQAVLRGILNRLFDLNLTLLSVRRLPPARSENQPRG